MGQDSHSQDRRTDARSVMDELIRIAKEKKLLPERTVRTLLAIVPLEKAVLEKGKVYFITEPITAADEQREFAPVASQLVEYLGFNNAESDRPGTSPAHLFDSRLLRQKSIFRLTTHQFRQLCEERKIFIVTGKVSRPSPVSEAASKESDSAKTLSSKSATRSESPHLSPKEDPGFAAVIQAVSSTTLQFQTEDRIPFQNVITEILQAQRVFNTLHDINQTLTIVQAAIASFESKVSHWENKFAAFFQQKRPESVGMTTINNLKAQQNKGRAHLGSAKYQFRRLLSNLEQAKINLEQSPADEA